MRQTRECICWMALIVALFALTATHAAEPCMECETSYLEAK